MGNNENYENNEAREDREVSEGSEISESGDNQGAPEEVGGEIVITGKGKLFKWLDNFWYHYKWHTIIAAFLLIAGVICTVQFCNREQYDINILYAGNVTLPNTSDDGDTPIYRKIKSAFEKYIGDYDGNGEILSSLNAKLVLSEDELLEYEKDEGIGSPTVSLASTDIQSLRETFMTDAYYLCFISPYVYENFAQEGEVRRFSSLEGYLSDSSTAQFHNSYRDAVKLSSTRLWLENAAIRENLPADTLIVLCKQTAFANRNEDEAFKNAEQAIREMLK